MRKAPPVKAELPPRQASGEISSCNTEAPFSLADSAAQVAALPAPTTMMSCSGMSMARPPSPSQHLIDTAAAVPTKAGTHLSEARAVERRVPAFAGTPGIGESDRRVFEPFRR